MEHFFTGTVDRIIFENAANFLKFSSLPSKTQIVILTTLKSLSQGRWLILLKEMTTPFGGIDPAP